MTVNESPIYRGHSFVTPVMADAYDELFGRDTSLRVGEVTPMFGGFMASAMLAQQLAQVDGQPTCVIYRTQGMAYHGEGERAQPIMMGVPYQVGLDRVNQGKGTHIRTTVGPATGIAQVLLAPAVSDRKIPIAPLGHIDSTATAAPTGAEWGKMMHVDSGVVGRFMTVSGDRNPIHYDLEAAAQSPAGVVIAHGMIGTALIYASIRERGERDHLAGYNVEFLSPVVVGDIVGVWIGDNDDAYRNGIYRAGVHNFSRGGAPVMISEFRFER